MLVSQTDVPGSIPGLRMPFLFAHLIFFDQKVKNTTRKGFEPSRPETLP